MTQEITNAHDAECSPRVVLHGVDTLVINVRYTDEHGKLTRALLDERFIPLLNDWQARAKVEEKPVPIPWVFQNVSFLMHPHGAGKGQWRWLLTSRFLNLALGLGKLNGIIAQVRCSSEYLWSCEDFATAVVEVTAFLYDLFGDHIALQPSEIHLCADIAGWDVPQADWSRTMLSRGRYRKEHTTVDGSGDGDEACEACHHHTEHKHTPTAKQPTTALEPAPVAAYYGRNLATLQFGSRGAALSAVIYDKTREIRQQSKKIWFYDFWKDKSHDSAWDGQSSVWRVEFRFKRDMLGEATDGATFHGINDVYELVERLPALWTYAAGHAGEADAWLRYVIPSEDDSNAARWELHPTWVVVQQAFMDETSIARDEHGDELVDTTGVVQTVEPPTIIRKRKQQVNIARAVKAVFGHLATLAAYLGGVQGGDVKQVALGLLDEHGAVPVPDNWLELPTVLTWFRERAPRFVLAPSVTDYQAQYTHVERDDRTCIHIVTSEVERRKQEKAYRELYRTKVLTKRVEYGLQPAPMQQVA
jgi:hypothetical protein